MGNEAMIRTKYWAMTLDMTQEQLSYTKYRVHCEYDWLATPSTCLSLLLSLETISVCLLTR